MRRSRLALAPGATLPGPAPLPRRRFLSAFFAALGGASLLGGERPARASTLASDPFIGELMLFGGNFAPAGWFFCDGSLLPIAQYDVLFAVIGTTYGGDGQTTYGLPDLRGRIPIHTGSGPGLTPRVIGALGGSEQVTLTQGHLPAHAHIAYGSGAAGVSDAPAPSLLPARDGAGTFGWGATSPAAMAPGHIGAAGSSFPHENRMPFLAMNWCIAWAGIFPSQ